MQFEIDGVSEMSLSEQADVNGGSPVSDFIAWGAGEIVGSFYDVGNTIVRGIGVVGEAAGLVYLSQLAQ